MNLLIAHVIKFVSGTMMTFSQAVQQKSNLSSSQILAPGLEGRCQRKIIVLSFGKLMKFSFQLTPINDYSKDGELGAV